MPRARPTEAGDLAAARVTIARDPRDVPRLLRYLVVLVLGLVAARGAELTTTGVASDVLGLSRHLPVLVLAAFVVGVQVLHLALFVGIPAYLLVTRRWRLWGTYTVGYVAASLGLALADRLAGVPQGAPQDAGLPDAFEAWPPSSAVATGVFAVVTLSPYVSRPWRRFGWSFVAALALTRVLTSSDVALDLLLAVGVGGTVAAVMLLAFGRRVVRPTTTAVLNALDRVRLHAREVVTAEVPAAYSTPFTALMPDGSRLHCKVISSQEYAADSLVRRYRNIRVRGLGEEVAYSTIRRAASVEAMMAMTAHNAGARTPAVAGVAPLVAADAMVIAFDEVPGVPLSEAPAERVTDDVLDQAWHSLAALRSAGLAHRDLQLSSWILDDQDRLHLIDFSFGEPAATDGALSADIAELLAATYAVVGAERAVAAAVRGIGEPALATGLGHLVPLALTRPTRTAVKSVQDGLKPLIEATAAACHVSEPEFAPIERVKPRSLVMAGMLALAVYVLLPQLADLPRMIESIREADMQLVALTALASLATYVGAGMAIAGSSPLRIAWRDSALAAFAATFVGALTPPGVAHAGLNARFFTKQGMTPAAAISSTAAKELAVAAVHVVLLVLMAVLAGSSGALQEELDKLPDIHTVGIAVAVALAVISAALAVPRVRTLVRGTVVPAVRESLTSLRELAGNPVRLLTLFVGSLLLQLGYVAALYFAVRALGGEAGFVAVGLLYLTVGSVASLAPTPGGIGAVEAVLLAALTGIGMAAAPALAAVFLFRLMTFWLPIPIGGLAFRSLASRDLL
jgi:glycosyltransferase 2 family protein